MDESKQNGTPAWVWLIVGLVVVAVISVCLVIAIAAGFFVITRSSTTGPLQPTLVAVEVATDTPPPTSTILPTLPPTNTAPPPATDTPEGAAATESPPADPSVEAPGDNTNDPNAALRASIEANVSTIRGLDPLEPVVTTLLTRDELRARVEEDLFADLSAEDAADFSLLLNAFDFVDRDFDYYNFALDLYAEQIAGFYDPETNEFVVVSEDDDLDVSEQLTHAHEFVHALQDQYFALDLLDDESLDSEAGAALLALIEGEATLVQGLYLAQGYFTFEELNEFLALAADQESPVFDNAPPVLANDLLFPYTAGYEFAQYLYDENGFDALDDAWANPPVSTEQILHPERYLAGDMPQLVSLAPLTDTLGAGWRLLDEDMFGEFYLSEYITQQLPDTQANTAAEGWGGDQYAVYYNDESDALVMTLRLAWDTPADADEFTAAYNDYLTALYGPAGQPEEDSSTCWTGADITCLYQLGGETFIVRAPDLATAQAVAAVNSQE